MDLHTFKDNPNVFFDPETSCNRFFKKASGLIEINGNVLEVVENSFF